jgi:hypothetical protein
LTLSAPDHPERSAAVDVVNTARWIGVLVAIVGAVIVAPEGALDSLKPQQGTQVDSLRL